MCRLFAAIVCAVVSRKQSQGAEFLFIRPLVQLWEEFSVVIFCDVSLTKTNLVLRTLEEHTSAWWVLLKMSGTIFEQNVLSCQFGQYEILGEVGLVPSLQPTTREQSACFDLACVVHLYLSSMVGTDELKNTAGFKLRGWPRPHLRLSPQFQFFPAIAMKLLTKWCFLNLINMILKVAVILSSLLTPADTQISSSLLPGPPLCFYCPANVIYMEAS